MRLIRPEGCSLENPKMVAIKEALFDGKFGKIQAIKEFRALNGCGLREAKDEVDSWIFSIGKLIPEISQFKVIDEYKATCLISFPNEVFNRNGKKFFPIEINTSNGWFSVNGFSLEFDYSGLKNLLAIEQNKLETKRREEAERKKKAAREFLYTDTGSSFQAGRGLAQLIGVPISWSDVFKCWITSSGIRFKTSGRIERPAEMTFEILSVPRLSTGQFTRMLDTFAKVTGQNNANSNKSIDVLKKILGNNMF